MKFFSLRFLAILFLLSCFYVGLNGQSVGLPFINSFPKESYGFGTQNWKILQLKNGSLTFANNDGLLSFDGYQWNIFPLPNKTILRSLASKGDTIYAGAQNEFGYYLPDQNLRWKFHSLKQKFPQPYQGFEDVWDIICLEQTIYIRVSKKLFQYKNDTILPIGDIEDIHYLGEIEGKVFIQSKTGQLLREREGRFDPFSNTKLLTNTEITSIIPNNQGFLISTRKSGIFLLEEDEIRPWPFQNNNYSAPLISCMLALPGGEIAVGTSTEGLIVLDKEGQLLYQIEIADGLPSNSIICAYRDYNDNLWLGMENGIAFIEANAPFRQLDLVGNAKGVGYDVKIKKDRIYFGTNTGLYASAWGNKLSITAEQLNLIPATSGQVWGLDVIGEQLFMSHNDGVFEVENNLVTPIYEGEGAWLIKENLVRPGELIGGIYKGIINIEQASLDKINTIRGFGESSRFIEQDDKGNLWVAHPYRGIFRIKNLETNAKIDRFGPEHGLPSYLHNHLFKINNELIICGEEGLYTFDHTNERFLLDTIFMDFFKESGKIRRLVEAPNKDIWFITDQEIGYFKVEEKGLDRKIEKRSFPRLKKLMNNGFEKIYPVNPKHVFISSIRGFLHYDESRYKKELDSFPIFITEVALNKDSVIYPFHNLERLSLPYRFNSLQFVMGTIDHVGNDLIRYQYYLEGFDEEWTTSSKQRSKEYTQLPYGKYTFKARAKKEDGKTSQVFSFDIHIKTPWFFSSLAILIYILLGLFLFILIFRQLFNQFRALENKMIISEQSSKAAIERLEMEKVQVQLDHKKRELLSSTIHLAKKNETLQKISQSLQEIRAQIDDKSQKKKLQKLIQYLRQEENMDSGWEQLMLHFNEIHPDFFSRLKDQFPGVTPKDLKLCAYLKMNLSTKEIANLMNISVRGIEASRYRLRKRLQIPSNTNLNDFFMNF